MSISDETAKAAEALETAGREYGKHSGPGSSRSERAAFSRDLCVAALRYARAYQAEARELGLIPEYERVSTPDEIKSVPPHPFEAYDAPHLQQWCRHCTKDAAAHESSKP